MQLTQRTLNNGLLAASALALTALWARQRGHAAEKKHPPVGRFIQVDGIRLQVIERGSGPAVLLLHGNGASAEDFIGCGLLQRLAERYRVVAIDRPGFGYSERPRDRLWTPQAQARLIAEACAQLGVQDPIVLGHSFGTQVALALALECHLPLRGLVLVSGYYFPTLRPDVWLLAPPAIPVVGDVMRYTVSPLLGRALLPGLLRHVFSPRRVDPRLLDAVPKGMMMRPWQLKAAAEESAFMVPAARALSRHYGELAVPVEIFAGLGDKHVKAKRHSAHLHEVVPDSRLHLFPDEGHMLHYGRVTELAAAIDRIGDTQADQAAGRQNWPASLSLKTAPQAGSGT